MKSFVPAIVAAFLFASALQAQQPLTVADMTLRLSGKETKELFYSFAAGDEILFSFFETENRLLQEVQITTWPEQVRYAARDIADTRDQKIRVPATGVYRFRFSNASGERLCRIAIQRRPASDDLRLFDTAVRWEERIDTFYVKGKTERPAWTDAPEVKNRRVLAKTDTSAVTVLEKTERIFSRSGKVYGSNMSETKFKLPENRYLPNRQNPASVSEVTSWAYWIGVGDEADRSFQDANIKAVSKVADAASGLGLMSGGYGALALLAVKGVAMFSNPPKGDNVRFTLWNDSGKQIDSGNSIVAYRRMEAPLQGHFTFQLSNDNMVDGINVTIKILAIVQTQTYRDEAYTEYRRVPLPESERQGKMELRTIRIPHPASF
ncbi:MAG: hypothetical protein IAE84_12235 [Saprospiraceae bacterium]|nr:hypothetical protein [Saprospiraceae bacterium]HRD83470.1 hypothetical protein [Saprospiraceae bacterium]